jgi:hypothetical protein
MIEFRRSRIEIAEGFFGPLSSGHGNAEVIKNVPSAFVRKSPKEYPLIDLNWENKQGTIEELFFAFSYC